MCRVWFRLGSLVPFDPVQITPFGTVMNTLDITTGVGGEGDSGGVKLAVREFRYRNFTCRRTPRPHPYRRSTHRCTHRSVGDLGVVGSKENPCPP